MAAVRTPPQPLLPPPQLCQDNATLYTLIHLPGNDENGDGGGGRCRVYVGPPWSAASLVRRIRVGLQSPSPRLTLFAILIVVTSAPGTTITMTMMAIFVGAGKPCAQLTWAAVPSREVPRLRGRSRPRLIRSAHQPAIPSSNAEGNRS
jgi:hypothetical protein